MRSEGEKQQGHRKQIPHSLSVTAKNTANRGWLARECRRLQESLLELNANWKQKKKKKSSLRPTHQAGKLSTTNLRIKSWKVELFLYNSFQFCETFEAATYAHKEALMPAHKATLQWVFSFPQPINPPQTQQCCTTGIQGSPTASSHTYGEHRRDKALRGPPRALTCAGFPACPCSTAPLAATLRLRLLPCP